MIFATFLHIIANSRILSFSLSHPVNGIQVVQYVSSKNSPHQSKEKNKSPLMRNFVGSSYAKFDLGTEENFAKT